MIILLFFLLAVLTCIAVFVTSSLAGVIDTGKFKIYKVYEGVSPYKGRKLIPLALLCAVPAFAVQLSLHANTSVVNFIKLYGMYIIVFCCAVIDSKRKIIPDLLILSGILFRAGIYIYEIVCMHDGLKDTVANDLIGLALGFGFLAAVSLVTKGALGFGDAKLFGIIGITGGWYCTYGTLLLSLIASAVFSVVAVATKKMGRKESFPFGPFIAIGYTAAVLLTCY